MKPTASLSVAAGNLWDVELTDDNQHKMLEFERSWWRYPGAKDAAIRERFGVSPTRYYQALNALIDRPTALAADPMTVRRLLRLRDQRAAVRASRRLG